MISAPTRKQVTQVLIDWSNGDRAAADRLMPLIYDELRQIARGYLQGERADHTLQATGLVHEAYLRLVDQTRPRGKIGHISSASPLGSCAGFWSITRGGIGPKNVAGQWDKLELNEALMPGVSRSVDLVALDDALQDLAKRDPRQSQIVELRFFGGLTTEEAAEVLDVSPRTVKREWRRAKAWLRREIVGEKGSRCRVTRGQPGAGAICALRCAPSPRRDKAFEAPRMSLLARPPRSPIRRRQSK